MMIIMTLINLLWRTQLLQKMMNSIMQFVKIMHHVFEKLIFHIYDQFLNDIEMKELKTDYEEIKTLLSIWQFMLEHIQNINKVLNDAECTGIIIIKEKSQWFVTEVKIVKFVCNHEECHLNQTKIFKITEWLSCKNLKKTWAFINVCVYYHI